MATVLFTCSSVACRVHAVYDRHVCPLVSQLHAGNDGRGILQFSLSNSAGLVFLTRNFIEYW